MSEKFPTFRQNDSLEAFPMNVSHLLDKGIGRMNEDTVLVGEHRFGVFDGASSMYGEVDAEGRTGGYVAANIARDTFLASSADIVATALEANRKIGDAMAAAHVDAAQKERTWCSTMAVVEIDVTRKTFTWAQIADSLIIAIKRDGTFKNLIAGEYDMDRDVMMRWKELADNREHDIRTRLQNDIVNLRRTANEAYGVLNGDPAAARFLRTGSGSLADIGHLLVFTDGMIPPKGNPAAPDDFSELVGWYLEGGLPQVRNRIRELETSDPNCWKYPRYKQSDDMAAVAVAFG